MCREHIFLYSIWAPFLYKCTGTALLTMRRDPSVRIERDTSKSYTLHAQQFTLMVCLYYHSKAIVKVGVNFHGLFMYVCVSQYRLCVGKSHILCALCV